MQPYEFINKEWIVSPTARRVYRAAAAVSLTLYFSLFVILWNGPTPFLRHVLFVGVVGTAVTGAAMEFFLFRFDDSPAWKQIFWFCAMLFAPLGGALYCFFVYSRSQAFRYASRTLTGAVDNAELMDNGRK